MKLTIGLFVEHYDPFVSGVISSTKTLRSELEARGHTVYIICPNVSGYTDTDPRVIRIPGFRVPKLENTTVGVVLPGTIRKLMKIKFDLIHGQEVYTAGMLGLHIAHKQRIPYVQSYHTMWGEFIDQTVLPWQMRPYSRVVAALVHPFLFGPKKAWHVFTHKHISTNGSNLAKQNWAHMVAMGQEAQAAIIPSAHLAERLSEYGLTTPVEVIPNGVSALSSDYGALLTPKNPKNLRVLSVARLSPEKRVEVLVQAIKDLKNVELIIVGDGPDRVHLEELVLEQKTARRVRFMGELSNESTRHLMQECDVLVLASYNFDNQPVVTLEALVAGLPIIYCDPKLTEGLEGDNSLLVSKDPKGFADGFKKIKDTKTRQAMVKASLKLSKNYTAKVFADRVFKVYEAALRSY